MIAQTGVVQLVTYLLSCLLKKVERKKLAQKPPFRTSQNDLKKGYFPKTGYRSKAKDSTSNKKKYPEEKSENGRITRKGSLGEKKTLFVVCRRPRLVGRFCLVTSFLYFVPSFSWGGVDSGRVVQAGLVGDSYKRRNKFRENGRNKIRG